MTAACRRLGKANTGIPRIFDTYGPGMRAGDRRMVPAFACQALRDAPLRVAGDGMRNRSLRYADDTRDGLRRTLEWFAAQIGATTQRRHG